MPENRLGRFFVGTLPAAGLQKHRRELWREFGISLKAGYKILEGKKIRSTLAGC